MTYRISLLSVSVLLTTYTIAAADPIDFSPLIGANAADADGQDFVWTHGSRTGVVNVRSSWPILAVDGAMRTPVGGPASLENPFTGTVTFTFDTPVPIAVLATFPSLTRDGIDGGRFEQVQLSSPGLVQFFAAPGTTAVYSGVGTSSITADDEFSPTPTLSQWGFVGTGADTTYVLKYAGTRGGLSETFTVSVVPEPSALMVTLCGLVTVAFVARRLDSRSP